MIHYASVDNFVFVETNLTSKVLKADLSVRVWVHFRMCLHAVKCRHKKATLNPPKPKN